MDTNAIGKVTATEYKPTSCTVLRFWVHEDVVIRPFDIVKIPHIRNSYTYAIVRDLQYITDSAGHLASYVSSDFGDLSANPQTQRLGTTIAEAEVLYNTQEIEMPIQDGASVSWADIEGIKDALGLRGFKEPIPAGYIRISNGAEVPIEFESAYLIGPEGAHLNIAGISGLATKTSYAMFLMSSIQQRLKDKATMIIFNVKGSDLLAVDVLNKDFHSAHKEEWEKCGLEARPLSNVTYLYPYAERVRSNYTLSHIDPEILDEQRNRNRAFNFFYDVKTGTQKLDLLFSDIDDPQATMESIFHELQLSEIEAESWNALREEVRMRCERGSRSSREIHISSWRKFSRLLQTRTENDLFTERKVTEQDKRRQILFHEAIKGLKPGSVLVIDVEPLPDYLQCLVFGDVIQTIYGIKLGDEEDINHTSLGMIIIFADELNKYAPKSSPSGRTLTRSLLDITERGRSLGIVLFGAEQFRSGVHDRILGNCSTNVYGRTSPVEIAKCPDYRYFSNTHKSTISRLPQGNLLLQHAAFQTDLIKVRFPHPCYHIPKVR